MATEFIQLAKTLHPRLSRFFKRFPPGTCETPYLNPFRHTYNPATGKWQEPIFSLRRQAEMVKLAKEYNVEELLPLSVKSTAARAAKADEGKQMMRMLKPKGHVWERQVKGKLEKRKQAMLDMPRLIMDWKQRGHGRGWKKWPK